MQPKIPQGFLPLALFAVLLILLPVFLAEVMMSALTRLGLSPQVSVVTAMMIFLGGMINIPVKRVGRDEVIETGLHPIYGMDRLFPERVRQRRYTLIAVNLGGCIVPSLIVIYELLRILSYGPGAMGAAVLAIGINIGICYKLAQPVPKVGIAMPAFAPAFAAAICAILLYREMAPSIAFCAGVLGPLVGADLLHLRDIGKINTGVASIGGAGTFDGIVLSGLLATLLA